MEATSNLSAVHSHSKAVQSRTDEVRQEPLTRAISGQTMSNYPAIYQGFIAKGIPESDIHPRENVFTFNAWRALGRTVRRGEHGVKVLTFIDRASKEIDKESGKRKMVRLAWSTTVFHVSQTEALKGGVR
jgi:antirestriction protein ArdC